MVDKNDPLLREVEEELRREQWTKLWEQYGTYFIAGAALIVVMVGGFKYWEARQAELAQESGARYEAALELGNTGKPEEQAKALQDLAASGPRGYAALSELTLAGAHLKAGRRDEALAIFERLGKDANSDAFLKSFAALQAASLRLGEADFTEMQGRLGPLAEGDSVWRVNARELLGIAALKAGKLDEARSILTPLLADPRVPRSVLERVQRSMSSIASSELAGTPPAKPAEGTPSGSGNETVEPKAAPN